MVDVGAGQVCGQRLAFGLLFDLGGLVNRGELFDLVTDRLQVRVQGFFQQAALLGIETLRLGCKL